MPSSSPRRATVVRLCVLLGVLAGMATASSAATIAYWTFDDLADGATAVTLVNETGNTALNGTAGSVGSGGQRPVHSADVHAPIILSSVGGTVVNTNNTSSLRFNGAGNVGGQVIVPANAALNTASFTVEGFVKFAGNSNWQTLLGRNLAETGGTANPAWLLDNRDTHYLGLRADKIEGSVTSNWVQSKTSTQAGQFIDNGAWHHFAMTVDAGAGPGGVGVVRFYVDYVLTATANLGTGYATFDDAANLYMGYISGNSALNGWLDEVRWSDQALTTSQFLQAVPEPSRMLLLMGGIGFMFWRRRRTSV